MDTDDHFCRNQKSQRKSKDALSSACVLSLARFRSMPPKLDLKKRYNTELEALRRTGSNLRTTEPQTKTKLTKNRGGPRKWTRLLRIHETIWKSLKFDKNRDKKLPKRYFRQVFLNLKKRHKSVYYCYRWPPRVILKAYPV